MRIHFIPEHEALTPVVKHSCDFTSAHLRIGFSIINFHDEKQTTGAAIL